jgi:substrate-binding family protein
LLKVAGKDVMEGVMVTLGNWPIKGAEELVAAFKKRTGEPWMTQDAVSDYGHVMIVKQALEKAASTDREKVNQAIHAIDTTTGPTQYFPGGRLRFDTKGRRVDAPISRSPNPAGTIVNPFSVNHRGGAACEIGAPSDDRETSGRSAPHGAATVRAVVMAMTP